MKNKSILILFFSLFLIIISIFLLSKLNKSLINTPDEELSNNQLEKYNLLLSDLETDTGKIEIKAAPLSDNRSHFVGIVVSYNNIVKLYNWQSAIETAFLPLIYFEDINNDGIKEIIINTTLEHGTGLFINEIHVLNSTDLSEYKIDDVNEYIKANIKTSINDKLTISIKGKEEKANIDIFKNDESLSLFKEASFENFIEYIIENNQINAIVPVQISATEFFGNLIFKFEFNNNALTIKDVYYDKYITDISQLSFNLKNYLNEEFPIFYDDSSFKEINSVTVDNITRILYTKDDSGEIFSYLIVNDKKYDIGSLNRFDIKYLSESFKKTDIFVNGIQLYKYNIPQGANLNDVVYFQIIDNKPVLLMTLQNSYEFSNNGEIMTCFTHGLSNTTTFIYRWADNGLYLSDLNTLFEADIVMFNSNLKKIYIIKKVDLENPENNRIRNLTLDGILVY